MVQYLTGMHFPLAFLIGLAIIALLVLAAGTVLVVAYGVMRLVGRAIDWVGDVASDRERDQWE